MIKKKNAILLVSILAILILILGITYASITTKDSTANQQLVFGDIYMYYHKSNAISVESVLPGADYKEYFEFTIGGKNTYTKKDIYYDIKLSHGIIPDGKTEENRIPDKYLKFRLVEVNDDNTETEIFTDRTYENLSNRTIFKY